MTKHDKIFLVLISVSLLFIASAICQNLTAQAQAPLAGNPADIRTASTSYDLAQTEAVRKKFTAMGLKPHEGKFWK